MKLKILSLTINIFFCLTAALALLIGAQSDTAFAQEKKVSSNDIQSISFSPDGKLLAICRGTADSLLRHGQIDVWNVETKKLLRVIKGFDGPVWSAVFLHDNRTLVSGSMESRGSNLRAKPEHDKFYKEIKWWNAETGELLRQEISETDEPRALLNALSADGKILANVEYYTQSTFLFSSNDDNNSTFKNTSLVAKRIANYFVDLNLLDPQTGIRSLDSKNISRRSYGAYSASADLRSRQLTPSPQSVVFSPVKNLLAIGAADQIKIFNVMTGSQVRKFKDLPGRLSSFRFSPDGKMLAAASFTTKFKDTNSNESYIYKSNLNFYDIENDKIIGTLAKNGIIFDLSFAPPSHELLIGTNYYEQNKPRSLIEKLEPRTGKVNQILDEAGAIKSFTLSPDGKFLAYVRNKKVVFWNLEKRTEEYAFDEITTDEDLNSPVRRLIFNVNWITAVSFSADGKTLAAGSEKNEIKLWNPQAGGLKKNLTGHEGTVISLAVSSDGKKIASSGADGSTRLWDVETGAEQKILESGKTINVLAFSPDEKTIAGGGGGSILLWEAQTGQLEKTFSLQNSASVKTIAFAPDNRLLAADDAGEIQLIDLKTGLAQKTFAAGNKITAAGFSPDGQTVAVATVAGAIDVWNTATGDLIKNLRKKGTALNSLVFSPNGKFLAGGGDDRKVTIWESNGWKEKETLKDPDLTVTALAFSPDSQLLAVASNNLSIALWSVENGNLSRILR